MTDRPLTPPPAEDGSAPGAAMDRRIVYPRRKRRRALLIAGGGTAAAALAALGLSRLPPPGSLSVKAAELQVAPAADAPFQDYLPVRGAVAPLHTTYVTAVSGGQVDKVLVLDGSPVPAGAALATLTNPQLKLDVTSKEADIAGRLGDVSAQSLSLEKNRLDAEGQVSQASFDLLKAEHDYDIRKQLHDKNIVSDAELKTYADTAAYDRARLAQLRAGQAQQAGLASVQGAEIARTNTGLRQSLDVVRASLDALVIRAPVAGRLTDFQLQPGQSLKAGDPAGQIDSEGAYKLTADVDEYYLRLPGAVGRRQGSLHLRTAHHHGKEEMKRLAHHGIATRLPRGMFVEQRLVERQECFGSSQLASREKVPPRHELSEGRITRAPTQERQAHLNPIVLGGFDDVVAGSVPLVGPDQEQFVPAHIRGNSFDPPRHLAMHHVEDFEHSGVSMIEEGRGPRRVVTDVSDETKLWNEQLGSFRSFTDSVAAIFD